MDPMLNDASKLHLVKALKTVKKRTSKYGGLNVALTLAVLGLLGWNVALVSNMKGKEGVTAANDVSASKGEPVSNTFCFMTFLLYRFYFLTL